MEFSDSPTPKVLSGSRTRKTRRFEWPREAVFESGEGLGHKGHPGRPSRRRVACLLVTVESDMTSTLAAGFDSLRRRGAPVVVVDHEPSGHAALDRLDRHSFDVVIVDRAVPDVAALTLIQHARRRHKDVRCYLIGDRWAADEVRSLRRIGVSDCLDREVVYRADTARDLLVANGWFEGASTTTHTVSSVFCDRGRNWGTLLRDILERASSSALVTDRSGHLVFVNAACRSALGAEDERIEGRSIFDVVSDLDAGAFLDGGLRGERLCRVRRMSGNEYIVPCTFLPIEDDHAGYLVTFDAP